MLQISTTELLILFKNKLCTKNNRQKSKMLIILKVKETILLISSLVPYLYQFHQIKTIHEEVGGVGSFIRYDKSGSWNTTKMTDYLISMIYFYLNMVLYLVGVKQVS